MNSVNPLRRIPGWDKTDWGRAFLAALRSQDREAVFDVWQNYYSARPLMAELVCCVLDILNSTGKSDNDFTAALLHQNQEHSIQLNMQTNDWSKLLEDSHLMAVYVLISPVCIECETPDHSTATCDSSKNCSKRFTALQTQLGLENGPRGERIKVAPLDRIYKIMDRQQPPPLMIIPEINPARQLLLWASSGSLPIAMECRDQDVCNNLRLPIFLRASSETYGGRNNRSRRSTRPIRSDNTTIRSNSNGHVNDSTGESQAHDRSTGIFLRQRSITADTANYDLNEDQEPSCVPQSTRVMRATLNQEPDMDDRQWDVSSKGQAESSSSIRRGRNILSDPREYDYEEELRRDRRREEHRRREEELQRYRRREEELQRLRRAETRRQRPSSIVDDLRNFELDGPESCEVDLETPIPRVYRRRPRFDEGPRRVRGERRDHYAE